MPRPPLGRAPRPPLGRAPRPWRNWGNRTSPQVYYVTEPPSILSLVMIGVLGGAVLAVCMALAALVSWIETVAAYASNHMPQIIGGTVAGIAVCAIGAAAAYPLYRSARQARTTAVELPAGALADQARVAPVTNTHRSEGEASPVQPVCAKCGTGLPTGAKFCFNCGERVSPAEPPPPDAPTHDRTWVFALANQKGHTGKTATAINLAACLASAGHRTLVVDMSPDAEATTGLGVDPHRVGLSIYELLVRDDTTVADVLKTDLRPNLALLPAKEDLYAADIELASLDQREYRLKRAIEPLKGEYDFVLIDCPASLGLLTVNALTAADGVILPLPCEYFALAHMQQLLNTIRLVRDQLNPTVGLFGVVLTFYDSRARWAAEVVDELKQHFPEETFRTLIPNNIRLSEAPSFGLTILEHDARSPGALAYRNLAEEVIARADRQ